ncbi:tryptophan synthase subunit beta like protein [Halioglobus maricola]|uniref:Tryptophan synthase subunit beta like protein n=1 Tax=Halioglobus maricola TaxID=2601894 RepID=A0A5P9NM54_9GAMM|nr:tryptophan synthase subunit beta like protein [Halioglobus maricola]QFU76900.1 tryptophan synthase subunit beta like protein [Halioglobus maricola]
MPYIKRDVSGQVVALSWEPMDGFEEQLAEDSPELAAVLGDRARDGGLDETDQDFVRVLEDVVELLIDKGIILFTDLPQSAQDKIMRRQRLRSKLGSRLNLIGDD